MIRTPLRLLWIVLAAFAAGGQSEQASVELGSIKLGCRFARDSDPEAAEP
jgi:hypothetical protein